jgi:hypothetical protein
MFKIGDAFKFKNMLDPDSNIGQSSKKFLRKFRYCWVPEEKSYIKVFKDSVLLVIDIEIRNDSPLYDSVTAFYKNKLVVISVPPDPSKDFIIIT